LNKGLATQKILKIFIEKTLERKWFMGTSSRIKRTYQNILWKLCMCFYFRGSWLDCKSKVRSGETRHETGIKGSYRALLKSPETFLR